jgi:O-antigen ligase
MLNALILLVTSFSLILYYYKKKPGVILGCFLLFPIIANIIQIELGLPFEFRYILRLVVLLIFIFQTFNSRAAVFNINWLLNSKIFFGILFLLIGILLDYLDGGINTVGAVKINRFLMIILWLFIIGAIMINEVKIIEQMSYGIIIWGVVFYLVFYLVTDFSVIDIANRRSFIGVSYFEPITLARMNGMILISGLLYSIYSNSKYLKSVCIIVTLVSLYWILVTATRGVIVSLCISLFIYFILNVKDLKKYFFYFAISIMTIILFFSIINLSDFSIINRFIDLQEGYTGMKRYYHYTWALEIFMENPIIGIGAGRYGYFTHSAYAHNLFLELISEFGLFGFVAWILIVGTGLYNSLKILKNKKSNYKTDIIILLWVYFLLNSMFSGDISINDYFWILTGVLISIIRMFNINQKPNSYQQHI